MRKIVLSAMAVSGLAMLGASPAHAVGTKYPFCLTGDAYPALSNCTFTTYEQCSATASGRRLYCIANPFFAGKSDDPYAYPNRNRPMQPGNSTRY